MDNLRKGLLFTSILALLVILFFFGNILRNPNQTYFAPGGDGFKSYYGAIYHLECDSTYFKFEGMNYPYGESVFFTDNQPLLANTVKWISNNMVDIRENIVGIINLSMIFSVLIAAIFLFLLFNELAVCWWFASLASVGICMLSPQIGRMAGHFSLSHLFWIPAMLYLIIRFSKKPGWGLSAIIALVGFLAASMQLYFIGFYGLLLTFYWLFAKNWFRESWIARRNSLLHWFLQIGVPFILLEILMISTDPMTDRTSHPYGFLTYLAHPVSVLLPGGTPYSFVPKYIRVFNHIDWEAYAFIGIAAPSGSLTGTVLFLKKLFTGKDFWNVSSNSVLPAFFWASFVALLLSFGKYFPLYRLFYMLPMVSSIRNPNKFLQVFQIAAGILAAGGLDVILRRPAWSTELSASRVRQVTVALVAAALVAKHGVAASRLFAQGAGPLAPVASNADEQGRAKNRRVELVKR